MMYATKASNTNAIKLLSHLTDGHDVTDSDMLVLRRKITETHIALDLVKWH